MMKHPQGRRRFSRRGERKEYPFYPYQLVRIIMAVMGAVVVLAVVAALFPLPLDKIADPLVQPGPGVRPLWILKPVILLGRIVTRPPLLAGLVALLAALFVLLPLLDRSGQSSLKQRALVAVPFLLWMLFLALSLFQAAGGGG